MKQIFSYSKNLAKIPSFSLIKSLVIFKKKNIFISSSLASVPTEEMESLSIITNLPLYNILLVQSSPIQRARLLLFNNILTLFCTKTESLTSECGCFIATTNFGFIGRGMRGQAASSIVQRR